METWIPLFQSLIWPLFIVVLVIVFKDKLNGLFQMAIEGRSLDIGGWIKIGEKVKNTTANNYATTDLSIEAIEGEDYMIEKGSAKMLAELQNKLRKAEIKSFDVLKITDNKHYYKNLLSKYISTLGIKHIVFLKQGRFDGWMSSSIFSAQLLSLESPVFSYSELKDVLVGIRTVKVEPTTKTSNILKLMQDEKCDDMAVVKNDQFKFIIQKQDILSALISNMILAGDKEK